MRRKSVTTEMMMGYIAEALFLLMKHQSFTDITIGDISEKAGVNRCTYYRHFKSKEDILSWFLDRMMGEYIAQIDSEADRRQHYGSMFRFFTGYQTELLLIWNSGLSALLLNTLHRYLKPFVLDKGTVLEEYTVAYHVGGVLNHLLLWFSRGMCDTPEEMADIVMTIMPMEFEPFLLRKKDN